MHFRRMGSYEEGEVASYHKALDVVGIARAKDLGDGVAEASHAGLACPIPRGKGAVVRKGILGRIVRHVSPIDAPYILAPSQDLADEALYGSKRSQPPTICRLRRLHYLLRAKHFEIEGKGKHRVEEALVLSSERILEWPKVR
jgi:hypothetical protein